MPSIGFLGALALGINATLNPSLAASFKRSWPRGAGRTSPAKPISPKAKNPLGKGLPRKLLWMANNTARSAAGSLMRTPPTAFTNTSWSMQATPACRCNTASNMAKRSRSNPTDNRRGDGPPLSTKACISTSKGRVPSSVTMTQLPGTGSACWLRKMALGLLTPLSPFSVIANTPISLTAPKRFLIARTNRKLEWVSPSKYNTVSTMCSSTRGPANAPSLVTCPTNTIPLPLDLANRVKCAAHSRTCATEPGALVNWSEYTVWIESITAICGDWVCSVAMIFSNWVSANTFTWLWSSPKRRARSATCAPDSSPVTYKVRWPVRCKPSSACNNSVDLPMPGSPPINTTPPSTMPPPNTRSSSSWPVGVRSTSCASISLSAMTGEAGASPARSL